MNYHHINGITLVPQEFELTAFVILRRRIDEDITKL